MPHTPKAAHITFLQLSKFPESKYAQEISINILEVYPVMTFSFYIPLNVTIKQALKNGLILSKVYTKVIVLYVLLWILFILLHTM